MWRATAELKLKYWRFDGRLLCVVRWNISPFKNWKLHILLIIIQRRDEIYFMKKKNVYLNEFHNCFPNCSFLLGRENTRKRQFNVIGIFFLLCFKNQFFRPPLLAFQWKSQTLNFRNSPQKKLSYIVRRKRRKRRNIHNNSFYFPQHFFYDHWQANWAVQSVLNCESIRFGVFFVS